MIFFRRFGFINNSNVFVKKIDIVLDYTKKVKSRHGIGLSTTNAHHNFGKKTVFTVRDMFDRYYFSLPVLHNILHDLFARTFHHFPCYPIMGGEIVRIEKYHHDKYFSIAAWGNSGGSFDT